MKIFTALMVARFFDSNDRAYLDARSFLVVMGIIGLPVGLIIIQPDFGTAASFFPLIGVAMFFGGIRARVWIAMILIAAIALPLGWMFFLKPYQKERVVIFLNPERDPLDSGYQVTQAKIAIGSGGIHGKGFRHGTQAKLEFLPARHTDFIFAVLGEEWGFIGVVIVLGLYLFLVFQALPFRETRARSRRDVPDHLSDLVHHLPRPDQRVHADRSVADDGYSAPADLVRRLVHDDVLHRHRTDGERGHAQVRERALIQWAVGSVQ